MISYVTNTLPKVGDWKGKEEGNAVGDTLGRGVGRVEGVCVVPAGRGDREGASEGGDGRKDGEKVGCGVFPRGEAEGMLVG